MPVTDPRSDWACATGTEIENRKTRRKDVRTDIQMAGSCNDSEGARPHSARQRRRNWPLRRSARTSARRPAAHSRFGQRTNRRIGNDLRSDLPRAEIDSRTVTPDGAQRDEEAPESSDLARRGCTPRVRPREPESSQPLGGSFAVRGPARRQRAALHKAYTREAGGPRCSASTRGPWPRARRDGGTASAKRLPGAPDRAARDAERERPRRPQKRQRAVATPKCRAIGPWPQVEKRRCRRRFKMSGRAGSSHVPN